MPSHPLRSGHTIEPFVAGFDAHPHEVAVSRRQFVDWMHAAEVDDDTIDEFEVVFSELAANAVAASPATSDDVRVRAWVDSGMLIIEVSNRTDRLDQPLLSRVPNLDELLRPNGRGLLITRAFVDSMDSHIQHPDRFVMRCCRQLAGRG